MLFRRSAALASAMPLLAACATLPTHKSRDSASQISFVVSAPPARVRDQLVAAFAANGLPVATSQPGVIEYHGPRERGILGFYEVFARAVIEPADCDTRVTLFGEETRYDNPVATRGTAVRIGPASSGRAADVWQRLQLVAQAVRRDSSVVH